MSAEISYVFFCIREDSRAVKSQTKPLCREVDPYQENLLFSHAGPKRESGGTHCRLPGPTNVNHHEEDDANHLISQTECRGRWRIGEEATLLVNALQQSIKPQAASFCGRHCAYKLVMNTMCSCNTKSVYVCMS